MRLGAFDYISKPPDLKIVEYGSCLWQNMVENKILKKKKKNYEMIAKSKASITSKWLRVAQTEARVLITNRNGRIGCPSITRKANANFLLVK
jgi:DNA-binding NtrC family response regulator